MEQLPTDVLADILSCLPPLYLAVSRSVCKAWCSAVDDRGLLRADLLPISMSGIFVVTNDAEHPIYFSRPPYEQLDGASFDYLGYNCLWFEVDDYCNGLLLVRDQVINPATRQWATVPRPPDQLPPGSDFCCCNLCEYLAFDPAATSPHYEVLRIHGIVPRDKPPEEVEWPPSPYVLCVFSSRTQQWEVKPFTREGDDEAGAIADLPSSSPWSCYSTCWRGALYVQPHDGFLMRITLSNYRYRITRIPKATFSLDTNTARLSQEYRIGKSKKGVYCALVIGGFKLLIWFLDESCGQMEWMLKKEVDLQPLLANYPWKYAYGPWKQGRCSMSAKAPTGEEFEWDSDDDSITDTQERTQDTPSQYGVSLLGFHPNKEIIFLLGLDKNRVLAYHSNTSKIEDLGKISYMTSVESSFPFTPCRMGELSNNK